MMVSCNCILRHCAYLHAFICIEIPADKVSKAALRGNLPPGYTFCNPEIGFASLKTPSTDRVHLLHCTEVEDVLLADIVCVICCWLV